MKYCYACGRLTPGKPLFCGTCGKTYDLKLCPRLHPSPRSATVCSQCGSRDLSTPQPRVPFWSKCFEFFLRIVLVVLFVYVGLVFLIAVFRGILASSHAQGALAGFAIIAGVLFWLWNKLPDWMRKLVRRSIGRKER